MSMATILIAGGRESLDKQDLLRNGFAVVEQPDIKEALQTWRTQHVDLLVTGSTEDGPLDALQLIAEVRQQDRKLPVILISSHSSEERVISALRLGVNDYLKEPYTVSELVASIRRLLASRSCLPKHGSISGSGAGGGYLVGESVQMRRIEGYLVQLAASDSNVLISGETGTGKERIAELIHQQSSRSDKPLVSINCAAIPDSLLESELFGYERGAFTGAETSYEGKLKLADGGTVFFDEIGDMSPQSQAKILRAIDNKETYRLGGKRRIALDFRVVAATNQDLENLVEENKFRKDLYYRLNVARIRLPPLRERKCDIPLLLAHYIHEYNTRCGRNIEGVHADACSCLLRYGWPGNIRELKNLVEAIFVGRSGGTVMLSDLPRCFFKDGDPDRVVTECERELLLSALSATNWNKSKAAQQLHWSRMTLYRKMAKYRIKDVAPCPEAQGDVTTAS